MAKIKFVPPRPTNKYFGRIMGSLDGRRKLTGPNKTLSDPRDPVNEVREPTGLAKASSDLKSPGDEVRKPAGSAKAASVPKGSVVRKRTVPGNEGRMPTGAVKGVPMSTGAVNEERKSTGPVNEERKLTGPVHEARKPAGPAKASSDPNGPTNEERKPTGPAKAASDLKGTIDGARELKGAAKAASDPKGPVKGARKSTGLAKGPVKEARKSIGLAKAPVTGGRKPTGPAKVASNLEGAINEANELTGPTKASTGLIKASRDPKGPVKGVRKTAGPAKAASNPKNPANEASTEDFTHVDPPKQKLMLNTKSGSGRKGAKTSSGREIKSTQDPQNVTAEELDKYLDDTASSSPSSRKSHVFMSTEHQPKATLVPCASAVVAANPQLYTSQHYAADINDEVRQLADILRAMDTVPIELPGIRNQAWTAKQLMHLYILCYSEDDYNSCDLIADTWIRAFQKTNASPGTKIWKSNKASNYKPFTPFDYDDIMDPELDRKVTDFDQDRLNELYFHTAKNCGARLLWADAMALGGDQLELKMEESEAIENKEWHKDIVWNIMRTSLRLARVKRTLKIEEMELGSWCDRYHEHGKQSNPEQPCYRELRLKQEADAMDAIARGHGDDGPVQSTHNGKRKTPEPEDGHIGQEYMGQSTANSNDDDETGDMYDGNSRKRVKFTYSSSEESDISEEE